MLEQLLSMIAPELQINPPNTKISLHEKKVMKTQEIDTHTNFILVAQLDYMQFVLGNTHTIRRNKKGNKECVNTPRCCDYLIVTFDSIEEGCNLHIFELKKTLKNSNETEILQQLEHGYIKAKAFLGGLGLTYNNTKFYVIDSTTTGKRLLTNQKFQLPISNETIKIIKLDTKTKYILSNTTLTPS